MNVVGLHHLARRYCIERIAYWHRAYADLPSDRQADGYHDTDEALDIFPRYNVLDAILAAVERYTPDSLADAPDPREALCDASQTADSIMIRPPGGPIEAAAIQDERDAFCAFVTGVSDLDVVSSLPFRRVLSDEEASDIWERLGQRFDPKRYDYPLVRPWLPVPPSDALAFKDAPFDQPEVQRKLQAALHRLGTTRVFQVGPELQWSYELDLSELAPVYGWGGESYWCDATFSWQVFASHESLTTVSGATLLEFLTAEWPDYIKWLDKSEDLMRR